MKPLVLCAGLLVLLLHAPATTAALVPVWNTTVPYAMTVNASDDHAPRFASYIAAWSGFDGHDDEIYLRPLDGRPQRALTDNAFDDELPAINEWGQVVWQGYDGHDWEIFSGDGSSGVVQITDNATDDTNPRINLWGRVVWQGYDGADLDIFSANADGSDLRILSDAAAGGTPPPDDIDPQIDDDGQVTWAGRVGSQWDIFAANANGTGRVNLSNSPAIDDDAPQIGRFGPVVWQGRLSATNSEIFSAPASGAGPVVRLTNDNRLDSAPQIGPLERVVWMTEVAPGNWDIHAADADGGNPEAVTDWPGAEQFPVIDLRGYIAWQGFDGSDWEIYARIENQDYQLTDNAVDDRWPAIRTSAKPGGGCPCPDPSPGVIWQADSGPGTPPTGEIWVETWDYQAAVGDPPPGAVANLPRLELLGGNPVRGAAEFRVALTAAADARVEVFDAAGRRLLTLRAGLLPAGESRISWDGRDALGRRAGAGVHFVRLRSGAREMALKLVRVP